AAGGAGVPGAAGQADRPAAAAVAAAAGEELASVGAEAVPGEGAAAGEDAAGGVVRGPARERAGLRPARLGKDPFAVRDWAGTGAGGAGGAGLDVRAAGGGAADRQA